MSQRRLLPASAILALAAASQLTGQTPTKKLIEFGWDRPLPSFVAANIATMEQQPFSGLVIQFSTGPRVFRLKGVDTLALMRDAALLRSTPFRKLTDNFVLMGLTPDSAWDWFDDRSWRVSESNVWRTARAARQAGLRGVALDYEPYGRNPWNFQQLPHGPGRAFSDYASQAHRRGRRMMTALQTGFPGLDILTMFQFSYLDSLSEVASSEPRTEGLAKSEYGLLPSFVAGMLEAANGTTTITDGNEHSYWYSDSLEFSRAARTIRQSALTLLPASAVTAYRQRVLVGHAIFVDYLLGMYKWGRDTVAKRVPPEGKMKWLEFNVYQALQNSDKYVWVYSQKMNWWKQDSVPPGLSEAIARAAQAAASGAPLGFGRQDFVH